MTLRTHLFVCFLAAGFAMPVHAQDAAPPGEEPVAPYEKSNANAGAPAMADRDVFEAFGGKDGISRIVDRTVALSVEDPRIEGIFRAADLVRLRRTLKEQFCFLLGGPCDYSGRDMESAHENMGLQTADFNALVEHLQVAMEEEGVPFRDQNRLLAVLAPMHDDVVER